MKVWCLLCLVMFAVPTYAEEGVDVQPADRDLTDIAELECPDGVGLIRRLGKWECEKSIVPPIEPPLIGTGTGTLSIETVGENTVDPIASAPSADVWVDALPPAVKTVAVNKLAVGNHIARSELRHGLVQSVGRCTYPEGGTPCTVSAFTDLPASACDLATCMDTIPVAANTVTKVVFKHRGVYEGFGAGVVGGRGGNILKVTNLNHSGAGSLRQALIDACNANNRYIVFAIAGTITLSQTDLSGMNNSLRVCGNRITVDGFTAPDPGITVAQYGINLHILGPGGVNDPKDTNNIILRGFRLRKNGFTGGNCDGVQPDDCEQQAINIETGASSYSGAYRVHDVVIDHMSVSGAIDDTIGLERDNYNFTISWNYISAATAANQGYLQGSGTKQISLHHNRWTRIARRNPQMTHHRGNPDDTSTTTPDTISADVRLNTTVAYKDQPAASHWGLLVAAGGKANAIKNYFTTDSTITGDDYGINNAMIICNPKGAWRNPATMVTCGFCATDACRRSSDVFVDGNVFLNPFGPPAAIDMNTLDVNVTSPIAAPAITEEANAKDGACAVRQKGGVRPLDAHDQAQEIFYANPCP